LEHDHLDQAALDRLLALDRTEDQNRVLLHQLAICPECQKVGGYILDLYQSGLLPLNFSIVDLDLARSRAEAPQLWESVRHLPHSRRLALAQAGNPFLSWGFCEFVCGESKDIGAKDAARAVELAELAVFIADRIPDESATEERWLYQLRAYAWAHLGNARRVQGNHQDAESAFGMADQWWEAGEEGTGDALGYRPVILSFKASLKAAQGNFSDALDLLEEAFDIHLSVNDRHLAGRVLINKSYTLIEMGDLDGAIPILQKAEELIDPAREPRLILCARHNLLDNLSKAGRFSEARTLLPQVQELSRSAGSQLDRVRLRWVEARIAAGLGETDEARQAFSDAQRGFLDQRIAYDAALVSLEMATFLLQEGRTAEVRELAGEMIPIFQAQDIHREALAALAVFQAAAALDSATLELAREVAAFLARARHDPALRFSRETNPPSGSPRG
jgi:tetratricopeptide (TPR) repeat protein